MSRLKAWGQGTVAPAHLQLRQCPTAALTGGLDGLSESSDANIANAVAIKPECAAVRHGPDGTTYLRFLMASLAAC